MALGFHGVVLKYITDLEKDNNCACSKNWKRDFIKYYLITSLVFLGFSLVRVLLNMKNNLVGVLVGSLVKIAGLVNLFIMLFYTNELKSKNCECSKNWVRKFMNNYSFFMLVFYPVVSILLLAFMLLKKGKK